MSLVPTQQRRWKDALYETSLHSVAETVKDEKASMVGDGGWGESSLASRRPSSAAKVTAEFCPRATGVRPCTEATEAEPRTKVTYEAD